MGMIGDFTIRVPSCNGSTPPRALRLKPILTLSLRIKLARSGPLTLYSGKIAILSPDRPSIQLYITIQIRLSHL